MLLLKYQSPALLWGLFILVLLLLPNEGIANPVLFLSIPADQVAHLVLFAVLGLLLYVGFIKYYRKRKTTSFLVLLTLSMGTIYGVLLEVLQWLFTQTRTFDLYDILFNVLGLLLSFPVFYLIYKW